MPVATGCSWTPATLVTPPGFHVWNFRRLKKQPTWTGTLRPASSSSGFESHSNARLVCTRTGPASDSSALLPGSNGSEASLTVSDSAVNLMRFYGGSDAGHLGVGAVARPASECKDEPDCETDLRTVFMARCGLSLQWLAAPTPCFDIRASSASVSQKCPAALIPGLVGISWTDLRVRTSVSSTTAVDGVGTLILPGGSLEVPREKTRTIVELRIDANVPALGLGWTSPTPMLGRKAQA